MKFIIATHKREPHRKPMLFITNDVASVEVCKELFPQKVLDNWFLFGLEADESNVVKDEGQIRKFLIEETGDG